MSGIRSRLKDMFRSPQSSSRKTQRPGILADPRSSAPSPSRSNSKLDNLGFLEISSGPAPIIDIVAIHGLEGDREKTWTTEDEVCWLRDFLPSDLSDARVLTYGYDADSRSRECVSTQTMRRHADTLVKALSRKRKGIPRRPIIFIAHDLGGIILKWALVICHNQRLESKGDLRDILVSTHAILFFGTPHSGVEGIALLEAINRVASLYMKTTDMIFKDLRTHSPELENIQSLYVAASEKIHCIFFCEEYTRTGIENQGDLNVPYHSAVVAGDRNATTIILHANHRDMVRFQDKGNDNYQAVLYHLKDYVATAPAGVKEKWIIEDSCRNAAKQEPNSQEVIQPKRRPPVSICYIERTEIQTLITQKLLPESLGRHQRRCILHGLGGAGKTQLATKWIRDHEKSFTRVIVVDASSQEQLEADLERSIRSLGPEYSNMTWNDAVAYLDNKDKGWLLFFDNADSVDLNLEPYLPSCIEGAIMITTRNRGCVGHAPNGAVSVGGLEETEAVELLHAVADVAPESDTNSLEIVRELGMLALAVTQAGAYIRSTRRLDTYLNTFRKHRARIMGKKPESGTNYLFSTYTAFGLSFKLLQTKTQKFMKLCAFLHHSLIPAALFEQSTLSNFTADTVLESCPPPEEDKAFISRLEEIFGLEWDEITFQEIVDSASRASLINVSTDGLFYTIHPLLQTYIKDSLDEDEKLKYKRTTAQLLLGAMQSLKGTNSQRWQLLAHVDKVPRSLQSDNTAHALAFDSFYQCLGDWRACRDLLESVVSKHLETPGENNEILVCLRTMLANRLHDAGLLDEAEQMERDILSLQLQILGRRHPDTISAMNNLALTLQTRGQLDEAEEMQRDLLTLQLEILDRRHPEVISAMSNLANTLQLGGQLDEAEQVQREVYSLRLKILGPRHLDTLMAMNNLANTLQQRGDLDEAEQMQRDVFGLRLKILGLSHPDTISALSNLAGILQRRGQLEEAKQMQQDVLTLRLAVLGKRNPDTLVASYNVCVTLFDLLQFQRVVELLQPTLDLWVEVFGEDHPYTRQSKHLFSSAVLMQSLSNPTDVIWLVSAS